MSAQEGPGGFVRAAMLALLPAASAGGGLALAPLLAAAGAASLRPSLMQGDLARPPLWLLALAAFTAWMAITALWTPYEDGWQALRFAATLAAGLLFARAAAARPHLTLAAGLAALAVLSGLLAIEAIRDMPLNRAANPGLETWQLAGNPGRGAAVLTALVWAGIGWLTLQGRPRVGLVAMVIAGVLAAQFGQTANIAAFAAGALAYLVGYIAPRFGLIAVSLSIAAWLAAAPFALNILLPLTSGLSMPYSWAARIEIWRYVTAQIPENLWLGHGLDASRADPAQIVVQGQTVSAIPLHPHSASLQIWFETGAVGAGLGALCLLLGGVALARALGAKREAAAAACGAMAAIAVIANVSFGAWQEWWAAAILIAAGLVAALAALRDISLNRA